jgi:hypothetical protein
MITIPNWMFLSSFAEVRKSLFSHGTIDTFIHNGRGVFGSDFGSCSFIFRNACQPNYRGTFRRLFDKQGSVVGNDVLERRFSTAMNYTPSNADFSTIPGSPVAYWISDAIRSTYSKFSVLGDQARKGLGTGNNDKYIRRGWEVDMTRITSVGGATWFPVTKGGDFRRWYGNVLDVLNYEEQGKAMQRDSEAGLIPGYSMKAKDCFFKPGVTWSDISVAAFSARIVPPGCIPMDTGPLVPSDDPLPILAALNSKPAWELLKISSSGVHFSVGHISQIPIANNVANLAAAEELVSLYRVDWDSFETSSDFQTLPVIRHNAKKLQRSQENANTECLERCRRMKELEENNNSLFIEAYGLEGELSPEVPDDQITLYRPNREEDIKRLLSYAIGCTMGRYSLEEPGLIYAHSSNIGFDHARYKSFPADQDGSIPVTEMPWFADDASHRFAEFVRVAWPKETLEENLAFVADSLGPSKGEAPRDTIRRYLATGFFKHHLQIYKRRPIYWLFSSGKQRAFQCLVYLHRYHEGTLSRMRTEYVIPLQGMIASRIEHLAGDVAAATSTAQRKKLEKERETLLKQQAELHTFDEKLRHVADKRIALDHDDGVKVNYGKFGDLLAEVKAVTGGADDE